MQGQGYAYLDVRSVPEFAQGHPAGAYNVPIIHMGPAGNQPNARFLEVIERRFAEGRPARGRLPDLRPLPAGRDAPRAGGLQQPADPAGGLRRARPRWSPAGGPRDCPTSQQPGGRPVVGRAGRGRRVSAPRARDRDRRHRGARPRGREAAARSRGARRRVLPARRRVAIARRPRPAPARPSSASRPSSPTRRPRPAFVDQAQQRLGLLDAVALVAGGWAGGTSFDKAPVEEWSRMLRGNLDSAAFVCRAALPHLRKQGGSIVAVGSRAAETRRQRHGRLRRLEGGAPRARPRAGAGEPRPGRARERGAARHDRHARESQRHEERGPLGLDLHRTRSRDVVLYLLSSESAATTGALVPVDAPG